MDESECSLNRTFKYNREPWGREFIYAMVPQQTISFHCRHNYRITEDNLDFLNEWDLLNAFWPHAIFTLEISMIMREHIRMYSGIVSLLLICSAAFFISETRGWKAPKYSRVVISVISGVVIGLLMQHWLLDWSYFRGGFLLFLPYSPLFCYSCVRFLWNQMRKIRSKNQS